ncbi:MAG: hypothetical protein ACYC7A_14245 [Thermoanaerobaculia bacterium]
MPSFILDITAALPFVVWNLFIRTVTIFAPAASILDFPLFSRHIVVGLLRNPSAALAQLIETQVHLVLLYFGSLFAASLTIGYVFGVAEAMLIVRAITPEEYKRSHPFKAFWFRRFLFSLYSFFRTYLQEQVLTQFAWVTRPTFAFVRTKDRLFYGQITSYEKTKAGDMDFISLGAAMRFSREKPAECLRQGRSPLQKLHGEIFVQWADILDINIVTESAMTALRETYARKLRSRRREVPTRPAERSSYTG